MRSVAATASRAAATASAVAGVNIIAPRSRSMRANVERLAASVLATLLRLASVSAVRSANDDSVCVQFITTAANTISHATAAAIHRP